MSDVVIVQPISAEGVALLEGAGLRVHCAPSPDLERMRPHLAQARAVITRNHGFDEAALEAAPALEVIGVHGAGTDRVAKAAAAARGIAVVNTPGTNARSVAELALALMLACAKDIVAAGHAARTGDTGYRTAHLGIELGGRRLGMAGFGRVARALVPMARGLGMHVLAWSQYATAEDMAKAGVQAVPDPDTLCAEADVLSLHGVPGEAPLIDAERLGRMRPGAILVNTARGRLVDEAALAEVLRTGHLHAAALDVTVDEPLSPDSPLLDCPSLILTPHVGGSSREAMDRTGREVALRVLRVLGIETPRPE